MNIYQIIIGVAGILALINLVRPQWPLCPVAVLLICVALLIAK